jgi:hypothetical protein
VRLTARPFLAIVAALTLTLGAAPPPFAPHAATPGRRVLLDAHNCYPDGGRRADRIDRAIATGLPVAIEEDLVWRPATATRAARSVVSHGEPFTGEEPGLREYFFERVRPLVMQALGGDDRSQWPLLVLNLDFKTNEPEHHRAVWDLLGEYESWLTTAVRTASADRAEPLDVKPVLVLTGDDAGQQAAFHDSVPVGGRLRVFGAIALKAADWARSNGLGRQTADQQSAAFWTALPGLPLPRATNYRRWWNNAWSAVEHGGPRQAGEWTAADEARLRQLVGKGHDAGLWVRFYTLNGHDELEGDRLGISRSYNFGSLARARVRWRAAIAAGVDFVAVDQYEAFAEELAASRRAVAARLADPGDRASSPTSRDLR